MSEFSTYTKNAIDLRLADKVTKPTVDIGGTTGLTVNTTVTIQMLSDWGIITVNDLDNQTP